MKPNCADSFMPRLLCFIRIHRRNNITEEFKLSLFLKPNVYYFFLTKTEIHNRSCFMLCEQLAIIKEVLKIKHICNFEFKDMHNNFYLVSKWRQLINHLLFLAEL